MAVMGLEAWLNKLNSADLPVLGAVVKSLNLLTEDQDAGVHQLAETILKDSNLTSQLLRAANSIHFNPGGGTINTVTRAIIQVGFEGVRNICISLLLVDQLLGRQPRDRLLLAMARAFHAAVQARALMPKQEAESGEQVFIAALLYHVGELAIWAKGGEQADLVDRLMHEGTSETDACADVLGLQFKALTREMARAWRLGELLEQALNPGAKTTPEIQAVQLADELSIAALMGWDSPQAQQVIDKIAAFRKVKPEAARKDLVANADLAAEVATIFGAAAVCQFIPGSEPRAVALPGMKPDPDLQLKVLRELSSAVLEGADVNAIFQMVLEGLHRGVGLARVAVILHIKHQLIARYALGSNASFWRENFLMSDADTHLFSEGCSFRSAQYFDRERIGKNPQLFTPEVKKFTESCPCLIAPVAVAGRNTGLFYADGKGAELSAEQQTAFSHFVQQAEMSLTALAMRVKR